MLKSFLKNTIIKNRALIRKESRDMHDFMSLLMKHRNTNVKWTPDEIRELKSHLTHLSFYVPALIIFSLPGGALLLPLLAEVMDRREKLRHQ
jgi:hypothetical protein